ncbi:LysR substrate-binding domain-containing protein [Vibrio sp. AK197]
MAKRNLNDLLYFAHVARAKSFTRAAAQLGLTQSALSQAMSNLEEHLGIRLLTRTTRSVSTTPAGERLLESIGTRLDEMEMALDALTEMRDKPAGTVRITCGGGVVNEILLPKLEKLLKEYPDIKVEFDINYGFRDIVADRFDAGIRLGDTIDKDMIAVPIGPKMRMAAVASPEYFAKNGKPQTLEHLAEHNCINMRFPTHDSLYVWEFDRDGKEYNVRVDGQLTFNTTTAMIDAAKRGLGIAFVPQGEIHAELDSGELVAVLEEWCDPFDGYYLYYPSRRQPSPAFSLIRDALKIHYE